MIVLAGGVMMGIIHSCNVVGPGGLFGPMSPHEKYGQQLKAAGLEKTALGNAWFIAAETSLDSPLSIPIPYRERGYFPPDKARAATFRFEARQGQKITFSLDKKPLENFTLYLDLWEEKGDRREHLVGYADTATLRFSYETNRTAFFVLRVQPELLSGGEYTLTIQSGPSLAFPVRNGRAQSFWGAIRDDGRRNHEGVDIFAPFRTPALAAAPGIVTRVGQNKLGGNVVFLKPEGKDYSLYYAHLDEQLVKEGESVQEGDTLGLIGTTGNARGGPPHLHFGIYTHTGAVDPYPFIDQNIKAPPLIKTAAQTIGSSMRVSAKNAELFLSLAPPIASPEKLSPNSILEVTAVSASWYKVVLPNGRTGFVRSRTLRKLSPAIGELRLKGPLALLDQPQDEAAIKIVLQANDRVQLLGVYKNFYFVNVQDQNGWTKKAAMEAAEFK